jgi:hypothetical protein
MTRQCSLATTSSQRGAVEDEKRITSNVSKKFPVIGMPIQEMAQSCSNAITLISTLAILPYNLTV